MSVRRLDSTGEPVFGRATAMIPTSSAEVAQLLYQRLHVFQEEWFLDRTVGLAAIDLGSGEPRIFGASADNQFLESEVRRVVLSTPGISALVSCVVVVDRETRRAEVSATVTDVYGEAISLQTVLP